MCLHNSVIAFRSRLSCAIYKQLVHHLHDSVESSSGWCFQQHVLKHWFSVNGKLMRRGWCCMLKISTDLSEVLLNRKIQAGMVMWISQCKFKKDV